MAWHSALESYATLCSHITASTSESGAFGADLYQAWSDGILFLLFLLGFLFCAAVSISLTSWVCGRIWGSNIRLADVAHYPAMENR